MSPEALQAIMEGRTPKGDALQVARIAGIQGGKRAGELIPLCHPLQLTNVKVTTEITDDGVKVLSEARCVGQTGVEMEALTAVHIALLTIYDMCKAVDNKMSMEGIRLTEKTKTDL